MARVLEINPGPEGPGVESRNHESRKHNSSTQYSPWLAFWPAPCGSHPARQVRHQLGQRLPTCSSHTNISASDSAPLPSFDPSHIQQVCKGAPTYRSVAMCERPSCGYSTGLPVMAQRRFLTPTSCRPSQVLSNRTNTSNASSGCCIHGGTSTSPPARMARVGFQGPRIP